MRGKRIPHLLLVDDDAATRYLMGIFCKEQEFTVSMAQNGTEALALFRKKPADVVVTDLHMPDMSGERVLAEIKNESFNTRVLIMTQYASIEEAVRFLKLGADDYITKPVTKDVFLHRTGLALERVFMAQELTELKKSVEASASRKIIGQSPSILALLRQLQVAAQSEASVVIFGESGTGKEMVASRIHELSRRNSKAFIIVNCGSIPDTLLESELFGYKRGAFTDAHRDSPGLVEAAEGGTLFLDEIGELSPAVQVKFLRFLQSKEYKPLGVAKPRNADVRIVAATNRDLEALVADNLFREDLFFRLNVIPLTVPPLRDRKNDALLLAAFFLDRYQKEHGKRDLQFSAEAILQIKQYAWPGNVRELENKVQQMVVLATGPVLHELPLSTSRLPPQDIEYSGSFKEEKQRVLAGFERTFVQQMLDQAGGNLSQAARMARLDRKNFWLLAKRHALWPISPVPIYDQQET